MFIHFTCSTHKQTNIPTNSQRQNSICLKTDMHFMCMALDKGLFNRVASDRYSLCLIQIVLIHKQTDIPHDPQQTFHETHNTISTWLTTDIPHDSQQAFYLTHNIHSKWLKTHIPNDSQQTFHMTHNTHSTHSKWLTTHIPHDSHQTFHMTHNTHFKWLTTKGGHNIVISLTVNFNR